MKRIFISHSHSDSAIAHKLVNFLLAAMRIEEEEILFTSNPDQGLSFSFCPIPDQLKNHLKDSEALIILITADSLHSAWIPFEAGSFWTTDKLIIPILGPSLTHNNLPGPLKNILSIPIEEPNAKETLNTAAINQLADTLKIEQKVTTRRNDTLTEFCEQLLAWKSQRINPEQSHQEEIKQLKTELENKELIISQLQEQINKLQSVSQQITVIELTSATGVDYTKLRDFLAAGKWEEADKETARVMLEAANQVDQGYLNESDIANFPCEDLRTIDRLWVHYMMLYRWDTFLRLLNGKVVRKVGSGYGISFLGPRLVTCNISPSQAIVPKQN